MTGRPRKDIDHDQMAALCRMKPSKDDVAAFFRCSPDTIENRVKEWGYESFSAFRNENAVESRFDLIRNAMKQANKGNPAMMIFCLKNLCGWTDKQETKLESTSSITITKEEENL